MELVVYLVIVRYYLKSVASMSLDRELEQCSPPDQFFLLPATIQWTRAERL